MPEHAKAGEQIFKGIPVSSGVCRGRILVLDKKEASIPKHGIAEEDLPQQVQRLQRALIETRREIVDKKPDLVQRFVDASVIGWYNYLYGDNKPGNAMIKQLNPEMTDELLAYSVAKMKEYGIVDSGDTLKDGIGAMTDARVASFFDKMMRAGVVSRDIDYRQAYTLRFANKGVGLDLRPKK